MGVHGWHRFLVENHWIPDPSRCCCSTSLWRNTDKDNDKDNDDEDEDDPFASRLITLGSSSSSSNNYNSNTTLLIDGNGLAFYIHRVAYARYIRDTMKQYNNNNNSSSSSNCCCGCALVHDYLAGGNNDDTLRLFFQLLPCFLPLQLIHDVTVEFFDMLQSHDDFLLLKVYWDGPLRHVVKSTTDTRRRDQRIQEWEQLQKYYYQSGILPKSVKSVCQFLDIFPSMSKLILMEIQYTITNICKVPMETITIKEEADRIMAKHATGQSNVYVVGNDTDFCFFENINYIPLSTLGIQQHVVVESSRNDDDDDDDDETNFVLTACVLRRDVLARSIGLDDNLMVELAILCGNDYLPDPNRAKLSIMNSGNGNKILECIQQLKQKQQASNKGGSFQITSQSQDVNKVLTFIRALYSFDDEVLATFPLANHNHNNNTNTAKNNNNNNNNINNNNKRDLLLTDNDIRPRVPKQCLVPAKQQLQQQQQSKTSSRDSSSITTYKQKVNEIVKQCFDIFVAEHSGQQQQQNQQQQNGGGGFAADTHNSSYGGGDWTLSKAQIDVFCNMPESNDDDNNDDDDNNKTLYGRRPSCILSKNNNTNWRPSWENVYAAYFIETVIAEIISYQQKLRRRLRQPHRSRQYPAPHQLFDNLLYQMELGKVIPKSASSAVGVCGTTSAPTVVAPEVNKTNIIMDNVALPPPPPQTLPIPSFFSESITKSGGTNNNVVTEKNSSGSIDHSLLQSFKVPVGWMVSNNNNGNNGNTGNNAGGVNHGSVTNLNSNNRIEFLVGPPNAPTSLPPSYQSNHTAADYHNSNGFNSSSSSSNNNNNNMNVVQEEQQRLAAFANNHSADWIKPSQAAWNVSTTPQNSHNDVNTNNPQPTTTFVPFTNFMTSGMGQQQPERGMQTTPMIRNEGYVQFSPLKQQDATPNNNNNNKSGNHGSSTTSTVENESRNDHRHLGKVVTVPGKRQSQRQKDQTSNVESTPQRLPVDDHEDRILDAVANNRVTVIQAETGAGKSTRVPCMLLRAKNRIDTGSRGEPRLFISQPRRIAAKALVERLRTTEPDLKEKFALRLGHGVREYESDKTRAWLVTTGYLVRLLANHPEQFARIDYIIIDEVHERSVDTDLLCFLCRRLLQTNDRIRLVLMSATLAAEMYRTYFRIEQPAIFVGARRFPVKEVYLDDLTKQIQLPARGKQNVHKMIEAYSKMKCKGTPNANQMELLYTIVVQLAVAVAAPGTSVLIFVAGMADIVALFDAFEDLYSPGIRYSCLPIHSDIPFEDQMEVFRTCEQDEVKIVLATNAAESSLTLPDVDNVICLGLCKRIEYNDLSHRQLLTATWISRASATQRSGRTGRVRPGTVYRLYTRENFERDMDAFEPGEIVRTPLDSVILTLRTILDDDEVTSTLLDCIEPPQLRTIGRSFESLYHSDFITAPSDKCEITTLGTFVSQLGIDLTLGALIGLGIQFGVAAESIQMAGVLTFPQTPWIMSNPMTHEPKVFNRMIKKTFVSQCDYDMGLLSEPFAIMNMLSDYENTDPAKLKSFIGMNGLHSARVRRLATTCTNLRKRVATFLKIPESELKVQDPPSDMEYAKLTILRVIQAWVFNQTIIRCDSPKLNVDAKGGLLVKLKPKSDPIREEDLQHFLDESRHFCELLGFRDSKQRGTFNKRDDTMLLELHTGLSGTEERFLSFASEKNIDFVVLSDDPYCAMYVRSDLANASDFSSVLDMIRYHSSEKALVSTHASASVRRGVGERACGLWDVRVVSEGVMLDESSGKQYYRFSGDATATKDSSQLLDNYIDMYAKGHPAVKFLLCSTKRMKRKQKFTCQTLNCEKEISNQDLRDLFSTTDIRIGHSSSNVDIQSLFFLPDPPQDDYDSRYMPLPQNVPEGYRLLSVLVAKKAFFRAARGGIQLPIEKASKTNGKEEPEYSVIFPETANHIYKWKRMGQDQQVMVNSDCIQATATPAMGNPKLFACAANCLELKKSGDIRAEGLTVLPQGPLFILLCRLSFGLMNNDKLDEGELMNNSLDFLRQGTEKSKLSDEVERDWKYRIEKAIRFHESCKYQGEELRCFPDKVEALTEIFDGIGEYESQLEKAHSSYAES